MKQIYNENGYSNQDCEIPLENLPFAQGISQVELAKEDCIPYFESVDIIVRNMLQKTIKKKNMLEKETEMRDVHGITNEQKQRILDFLQGAVYNWCKNRKGEKFAARDLLGGDNYYWKGTPMIALYEKSKDSRQAGIDAGWLLKKVINDDKRNFLVSTEGRVKTYCWDGKADNG